MSRPPMKSKAEWVRKFRLEAADHLRDIRQMMQGLDWERRAAQASPEGLEAEHKQVRQLFVRIHGLKGTAGMIGLTEIASLAAELEALWGETLVDPDQLSPFLQALATTKLEELTGLIETLKDV